MKKLPLPNLNEFLEIRGNTRLLAEGFAKMTEYGSEKIVLQGKNFTLTVKGKRLTMHYLSGEKIAVQGYIRGVEYEPNHS